MVEGRRKRYRLLWTAAVVPALPLLALGTLTETFLFAGIGLLVGRLVSLPAVGLDATETDAVVRRYTTRHVPWGAVRDVRPGSWWRGGIVLQTTTGGSVRVGAPCSWWGGPADARQVAEVHDWWVDHRGGPVALPTPAVHVEAAARVRARYRTTATATPSR